MPAAQPNTTTEDPSAQARETPWPTVGVSVVIFSIQPGAQQELSVLLVRRNKAPYADQWALPGGWVRTGEGLEAAAQRHLHTKAGLTSTYLEQLYTFGRPDRDPREHRIAVAYYALVSSTAAQLLEAQPNREACWFPADQVPRPLAFDHNEILSYALWRLRNKVSYAYVAYQLLPPTFTLADLRKVYEVILGHPLDPTNFRRKVEASGTIVSTGKRVEGGAHRPPQLYRCNLTPDQLLTGPPS